MKYLGFFRVFEVQQSVFKKRILIVDTDDALRQLLVEQLEIHEEFDTSQATSSLEAINSNKISFVDLILIDENLADISGIEFSRIIRDNGSMIPIILFLAQNSKLNLGTNKDINDWLYKPIRFSVLLFKIQSQLLKYENSDSKAFKIGRFKFSAGSKTLFDEENNLKIRLTQKEAAILQLLHRANSQIVSRDTLLREVWGYNSKVTTHTLETHMYRLRKKIENKPSDIKVLITELGGYRLEN